MMVIMYQYLNLCHRKANIHGSYELNIITEGKVGEMKALRLINVRSGIMVCSRPLCLEFTKAFSTSSRFKPSVQNERPKDRNQSNKNICSRMQLVHLSSWKIKANIKINYLYFKYES